MLNNLQCAFSSDNMSPAITTKHAKNVEILVEVW